MDEFLDILGDRPPEGVAKVNVNVTDLITAWCNEANAPEILPYKEDLVSEVKLLYTRQMELIDEQIDVADKEMYFTITLYQMELERIRYSLSRYLRTRILKIEKNMDFLSSDSEMSDRLSFEERGYLASILELANSHFEDVAINRLRTIDPVTVDAFADGSALDRRLHATPQLQEYVYCRSKVIVNDLELGDDQTVSMTPGDIAIVKYVNVAQLVVDGSIDLL